MTITVETLEIEGPCLINMKRLQDERGYFLESFNLREFSDAIQRNVEFVQDNHSMSIAPYTLRGLHCQLTPNEQGKLVRCTVGRIFDVAVDIRPSSKTYGQYVSVILSAQSSKQFWIPEGFLHGFLTLEPKAEVQYKCTSPYTPQSERTVRWNDIDLNITWPVNTSKVILSEKDKIGLSFANFSSALNSDSTSLI